jgi:hypothetical protein
MPEVRVMSLSDWLVLALGLIAIAWVNWYFFLAEKAQASDRGAEPGSTRRANER